MHSKTLGNVSENEHFYSLSYLKQLKKAVYNPMGVHSFFN